MARLASGIPLVGRRAEMRTLHEALLRARSGQAGAVLLSGDAGVGKSRLVREIHAVARAEGDAVLTGRCLDTAEATLPYLPFAEAIRQLAELDAELVAGQEALLRLLPGRDRRPDAHATDHDLGQLQLFDALHSALSKLATTQTTVLSVEDLHWSDRSSRDLLAFLLSRLSTQRLLIVGTFRSDDLHRRHPLRPLLAELVRLPAVERLHLEPFSRADATTFVRQLADQSLSDEVVRRVAEASEGNAFMAEELVSASSDHVPHELAEILLARIERLTPATQQVVRLASVLGRRFTHERLSKASTVPGDELDQALREALADNVLVIEESGEAYAFRHALLREAVYTDLLPGERSRLHGQVARALADDESPGAAAELAHHAMESHDLPAALAASVRAAQEADELDAPAEMLVHAERALKLWSAVDNAEQASGVYELRLTIWAARAAASSGEPDRAIAHTRSAIELADFLGDALKAADLRRKYVQYLLSFDGTAQRAYDTAREAWQLVADREASAVKAWVLAMLARASACLGKDGEAKDLATEAMVTARAAPGDGAPAPEADALVTRTRVVEGRKGLADEAVERFRDAAALASKADAFGVELRARFFAGMTLLDDGRLRDAVTEIDVGVDRAVRTGLTWSAYGLELRVLQVISRFMAGDWDGAEAAAELAGEAVSGTVLTRVSAAGLLVTVARGRFDVADRRLTHLRERWQIDSQVATLVGVSGAELESWRGRPAGAADYAEEAIRRLREVDPWHLAAVSLAALGIAAYADVAAAARRARDQTAERQAIAAGEELAARAAETKANARPSSGEIGPEGRAWMLRVEVETARLHGRSDPRQWLAVVDAFGYGEIYRQAYARWRAAEALLAGGDRADREEATHQLRIAAQVARELDAAPLREAVLKLARRGRIALDQGHAVIPTDVLTPREQAVLALVAAGRTNRQIGAELFISEKTVSVHLSRVMAKLGVTSRTEAVSTAFTRGLLTG